MGKFTCTSCGAAYDEDRFLHEELARKLEEKEVQCSSEFRSFLLKTLTRLGLTDKSNGRAILDGTADIDDSAAAHEEASLLCGPVAHCASESGMEDSEVEADDSDTEPGPAPVFIDRVRTKVDALRATGTVANWTVLPASCSTSPSVQCCSP